MAAHKDRRLGDVETYREWVAPQIHLKQFYREMLQDGSSSAEA